MSEDFKPRNHRIMSIRTKNRILHVEDHLDIDRIRFELWDYERGNGARANANAYIERDTIRVIAQDLCFGDLRADTDGYEDLGGGKVNGTTTARILKIENADTSYPIRITIKNGPGVKQPSGLISPQKGAKMTTLHMLLSRFQARKLGLALVDHIRAWETNTYRDRVNNVWTPDEAAKPDPTTGEIPTGPETVLRYGDDNPVSDNRAEIQAFQAYVAANKTIPPSIEDLRQWVRDTPSKAG